MRESSASSSVASRGPFRQHIFYDGGRFSTWISRLCPVFAGGDHESLSGCAVAPLVPLSLGCAVRWYGCPQDGGVKNCMKSLAVGSVLLAGWLCLEQAGASGPACPCDAADGAGAAVRELATPTLRLERGEAGFLVYFSGVLESAQSPLGPWLEVPGASSPHTVTAEGVHLYYRERHEYAGGPLFAASTTAPFTVTGPLQLHFEMALAGVPDGFFPPRRDKPYFDGSVLIGGKLVPLTLKVRGNSSLQECPFPKLKFKIGKEARLGTPFEEAREIKIGTHCAESGRGNIGRLRDERATYREALAYELMDTLGFTSPKVRRARIAFHDTSPPKEFSDTGWQVTRNALLLEDIEVVAVRLGGTALTDEEIQALTDANLNPSLVAGLKLFHALLGNWDYSLSSEGRGLWSTEVVKLADGSYLPVAGDFDLSSFVTERVQLNAPWDFFPELPDLEREARYRVNQVRTQVSDAVWASALERFAGRRTALEARINAADLDEPGRESAQRHVAAFYEAIAAR